MSEEHVECESCADLRAQIADKTAVIEGLIDIVCNPNDGLYALLEKADAKMEKYDNLEIAQLQECTKHLREMRDIVEAAEAREVALEQEIRELKARYQ